MNGQTSAFGQANYGASKGGIIAFTKTAALELAKFDITVNAICPGFTMTDMFAKVPEDIQNQIKAKIPAGRFGTPEDIAKAVIIPGRRRRLYHRTTDQHQRRRIYVTGLRKRDSRRQMVFPFCRLFFALRGEK